MAITTSGGSGSGSTPANTLSSAALFTTPATANTIFLISIMCIKDGTTGHTTGGFPSDGAASVDGGSVFHVRAGPSTAVYMPRSVPAGYTIEWTYTWVGITFS